MRLRAAYPLIDMHKRMIDEFRNPPASPKDCIFARTTLTVSADLKTRITPCQFGGTPDCSQCGCIASMGLAAVGHLPGLPGRHRRTALRRFRADRKAASIGCVHCATQADSVGFPEDRGGSRRSHERGVVGNAAPSLALSRLNVSQRPFDAIDFVANHPIAC